MTTSKFKRLGLLAALVVGGVTAGSLLAPIGIAAAQDDADSTTESDADTTEESEVQEDSDGETRQDGRKGRRSNRRQIRSDAVTETLGLTVEEVRQGFEDGKSLADMAEEQGVELSTLRDALISDASEHLDLSVEQGRIEEADAAEKLAELESRVDERLTTVPDLSDRGRGHGHGGRGAGLEALEELLDLTGEEIRAELADGKTLAEIGEQQGVSAEDLADAMVASMNERLDEAVAEGNVDEERADEIRSQMEEKVEERLNGEFESGRRGRGHRHGQDRDAAEDSVEDTVAT